MNKKTVWALFSAADGEAVRPILEALEKKGFRVKTGSVPRRGGVALLFLSAAFAADEELKQRFFAADSAGCGIIPLDLDGAPQSELARSALIAKNAITAAGRTSDELAARVASADAFASERRRLPRLLLAAALLLVLGAGFWIWRSLLQKQEPSGPSVPALSESSLAAARRLGLTPEDLAAIESFTVVGDAHGQSSAYFTTNSTVNPGLRVYLRDLAYDSEDDGGRRWYSIKDGHEFTLTHYDDLSVIELMPNLHSLTLVLVEADKLPELKALDNLDELRLENCRLGSLDWAAGSSVMTLFCRSCDIEDFSALGSMPRLREAVIELDAVRRADFSSAAATELRYLEITARGNLDEIGLSGFSASALRELTLEGLPLRDIAFLEGLEELEKLELKDLPQLRGIEPVASLSALDHLWMNELPCVSDVSAAGSCAKLTEFGMENMHQVRDLDFLSNCRSLRSALLENVEIDDLDFVESLGRAYGAGLSIGGRVGDWSGLSRCSSFGELRIRPENGSVAAILPYLQDCVVSNLEISNARDLDLAALPKITGTLNLSDCPNVEDLSALSDDHSFLHLFLSRMSRLRSLDGLEKNTSFGRADSGSRCELWIDNCPRLEDWSALDGKMLAEIRLANVYSLPDFGALQYSARALLRLENIPGVTDLGFLDAVAAPEKSYFSFELVDLDELSDISALRRFRGEYLAVMPALEAQAQALVESKNFGRCDIAYPSGGWNGGYDSFTLLSLDELDTLSDAALSRVTSLSLAGDQLVDRSRYDVWNEWDGAKQRVYLVDRDSGERTEVTVGGYTDLSALSKLTGLRQLELCALPIESLEGIQVFAELEQLRVRDCPRLSDASAAFTLQNLRFIELGRCPIGSIMGVQNCTELCGLSIYETDVKDLSPLRELDYGAAIASGGFSLSVGVTDCEDYSPIEAVPALSDLDLNGVKYEKWPDLSRVGELRSLSAHGDELSQEAFEELLRAHPELEELQIPWSREIRDLTPLLGMEKLRRVVVSRDMEEAVATLDGTDCSFELEIFN